MRLIAPALLGLFCMAAQASDIPPSATEPAPTDPVADAPARLIFSRDNNAPNACDVELYANQQVVAKLGPASKPAWMPSGELGVAVAMSPDGYCGGRDRMWRSPSCCAPVKPASSPSWSSRSRYFSRR